MGNAGSCSSSMKGSHFVYHKPAGEPKNENETAPMRFASINEHTVSPQPGVLTSYDMFHQGVKRGADEPCLGFRVNGGDYQWISYNDMWQRATNLGSGLMHMNACPEQSFTDESYRKNWRFIGIYSKNRPEWTLVEVAATMYGIVLVPIYDTLGAEAVAFMLTQTKLATIACAPENLGSLLKAATSDKGLNLVKNIVIFAPATTEQEGLAASRGIKLSLITDIENDGAAHPMRHTPPEAEDVNTICYTSGTTGDPKGAMLTHKQFVSVVASVMKLPWLDVGPDDVHISYLPAAHILERIVQQYFFYRSGKIGFYQGDTLKIMDDCQALKPTVFVSVPRLYNRIYSKVMAGVAEQKPMKQKLFNYALNQKLKRLHSCGTVTHPVFDKVVFKRFKGLLGGKVRWMLCGAAPITPTVQDTLRCIFSTPIIEGYGMTESTGGSCLQDLIEKEAGHVGGPLGSVDVKLVSVPDLDYRVTDLDAKGKGMPRGEICFKGPGVFPGYFRGLAQTKETIDSDGWLHTGDVGVMLPSGAIKIIDRKKNMFKLSQGEYVAVEKVEAAYALCRAVAQVFVYGHSSKSFIVAVVVPDEGFCKKWLEEKKLPIMDDGAVATVCLQQAQYFKEFLSEEFKKCEADAKLQGFEKVKKFHLSREGFTIENNLLTPSFKLKRNQLLAKFKPEIDAMYVGE